MEFNNKVEMLGERQVRYIKSPIIEGKTVFLDVATGNIVAMPTDMSNVTAANVWYSGYDAFGKYPLREHIDSSYGNNLLYDDGIMILSKKDAGNYNIAWESSWDAIIDNNEAILSNIEKAYDISLDSVNTMGLSYGDALAMRTFANSDKKGICCIMGASNNDGNTWYGDFGTKPPKNIGLQEGGYSIDYDPRRAFMTSEEYQNCVGRKFFIFESGAGGDYTYVKTLVEKGADVYWFDVYYDPQKGCTKGYGTAHEDAYKRALNNGLYKALSGDEEAARQLYEAFRPKKCTHFESLDGVPLSKNNTFVWEEISFDEFYGTILSELSDSVKIKPLGINPVLNDLLSSMDDDTIISNLETVVDHMNAIRGVLNGIEPFSSLGGVSTVLITVDGLISQYGGSVSAFADSLGIESQAIVSHAEGIAAMDADLDDKVQRYLSDTYNGTNLVGEVESDTASGSETTSASDNNVSGEKSDIDYTSLDASQLNAKTAEAITNDLKYHDDDGNVLEVPRDDTEVLLKFLEKEGYDLPTRITIKNVLTTDECAKYCEENGYSNTAEEGLYAQLEFVIRETEALSNIKTVKSDTLSHTMRAKYYNIGRNLFGQDDKSLSDTWANKENGLYYKCVGDYDKIK